MIPKITPEVGREYKKEEKITMPSIDDVYPSDLLSAQDIIDFGGKKVVVVKEVVVEPVGQGASATDKIVVSFVGIPKRLACNKTNANKIAEISSNKDYTKWQGTALELYTIVTTFKGQEVDAIRVRAPAKPKAAEPPAASSLIEQTLNKIEGETP